MNSNEQARSRIQHGNEFPYDAPDDWWNAEEVITPSPPTDWAHSAARGILADLEDRRGIKNELHNIDEQVRVDIVQSIAAIIRVASEAGSVPNAPTALTSASGVSTPNASPPPPSEEQETKDL